MNKVCEFCKNTFIPTDTYGVKYKRFCSLKCSNSGVPRRATSKSKILYTDLARVIKLYCIDLTPICEIAKMYNCHYNLVKRLLLKNNISLRNDRPKLTPENREAYIQNLIKTGKIKTYGEAAIRNHYKKILLHKNGNKCNICNNTTWLEQPIPLICDHIDGNSDNCKESNFRLVCPNCDRLLPTFCGRNKGKGRIYNRKYYQDNKEHFQKSKDGTIVQTDSITSS